VRRIARAALLAFVGRTLRYHSAPEQGVVVRGFRIALLSWAVASFAVADTVELKNGDVLHGTIGQISSDNLKLKADAFGEIGIKLDQVKSYKIDTPAVVQFKDKPPMTGAVVGGENKSIKVDDQPLTFDTVKVINPPPEHWAGSVLLNSALARGNTNKFTVGLDAKAALRRENYYDNDRTTLNGQYNFGQSGTGEDVVTDTDNFTLLGKYDRFWTQKLYGYVATKLEHDRIADLYYRVVPNIGLGYQWIETPATNFFTEGGIGYTFERFDDDTSNEYVSLRLAYHLEHALNDKVAFVHNLEYLPSIEDPGDYNLNADAGLKMTLVQNFIAQFTVQYKRDSQPSEDALKNDVMFLFGLGWTF
jgi:putative salt-induced outer membrane protein YdiY